MGYKQWRPSSLSKDGGDPRWYKEMGGQPGRWNGGRGGADWGGRGIEETELARLGSCWGKVRGEAGNRALNEPIAWGEFLFQV